MVIEGKLFSSGLNRSEKIGRLYIQLKSTINIHSSTNSHFKLSHPLNYRNRSRRGTPRFSTMKAPIVVEKRVVPLREKIAQYNTLIIKQLNI